MDTQLPTIDEANSHVLNSVDSVSGQEMVTDIDIENIKAEIVSIQSRDNEILKKCFLQVHV